MLNDWESHFSQPKLEFYGLYHVLGALCLYVIGVQNLVVEVDAHYIKGTFHGLDRLSHRPNQPGDSPLGPEEDEDIFEDWVDCMHGFMHIIQPLVPAPSPPPFVLALTGARVSSEEEGAENEEDHFAELRV
ncbi:hypothetical protein DXG03_008698 [Asterophora parasitica]|uniref:Uncharacterized protein n=1 Tax=Asterophora parasitica TaxID=117018 RepID=A0A9P7FXM6_9AGAR|nr:hypothetical protein DXG03_008698 [Asterophora parasitica]